MDNENIIIDIPMLEEGEKPPKKSLRRTAPTVAAILFLVFSLIIHSAMAVKAVEYLKNEGSQLLFSFLIPDFAVSEPLTPPLPEGSHVEDGTESGNMTFSFVKTIFQQVPNTGFHLRTRPPTPPIFTFSSAATDRVPFSQSLTAPTERMLLRCSYITPTQRRATPTPTGQAFAPLTPKGT